MSTRFSAVDDLNIAMSAISSTPSTHIPPNTTHPKPPRAQQKHNPITSTKQTTLSHHDKPISYQHRFSTTFSNDFDWLGVRINGKRPNLARLWCQNINGIKRTNNFVQFAESIEELTRYEVDFLAFTETNLNASNAYVRDSIAAIT